MNGNKKVTFTFYTARKDAADIQGLVLARRIRMAVIATGENMSAWARELKVSRQYVYQVVSGKRKNKRVRDFIEERLGKKFWNENADGGSK